MTEQKYRIKNLDSLRGMAAIAVVFYHFLYLFPSKYGFDEEKVEFLYHFQVGVHLFFMISGFVIFMTITKCDNVFQFIWSRFTRLYPVYWCAVIITFIVVSSMGPENRKVKLQDAFVNLTMFQEYVSVPHVDGVYWTLSIELAFYILIGSAFVIGLIKYAKFVCIAWLLLAIIIKLLNIDVGILEQILLLDWCQFFCAGVAYYILWRERAEWGVPFLIIVMSIIYSYLSVSQELIVAVLSMYILFGVAIYISPSCIQYRILQWLGGVSYPLYLIHQNIGYSIILNLTDQGVKFKLAVIIVIILSLFLAYLLNKYIEVPSLNILRKLSFFRRGTLS